MSEKRPDLFHRIRGPRSILTLRVSNGLIYAGTQGGDLLVWTLDTFESVHEIHAHRGSLLDLCLSPDAKLLFSTGGDAIVNVWSTKPFRRIYSIYSTYDVGDVFCAAYSAKLQTVYLGAQNTSIQWYDLSKRSLKPPLDPTAHPSYRNDRFFDSKGPGGVSTPRSDSASDLRMLGGQDLEIAREDIVQYAHYGYVYCMRLIDAPSHKADEREILISGGGDGAIKMWSLDENEGLVDPVILQDGDDAVLSMAIDGNFLYAGRLEGYISVWDLETRQIIRKINTRSDDDILTLAFGSDLLFSGSSKGQAKIFDSRNRFASSWKAHEERMLTSTVTIFRGRELYVTGGSGGSVAIWDISDCFQRPLRRAPTSNEELIMSLEKFVSYRTISSQPEYAEDCRRGASYLRNLFKRFGAETELFCTNEQANPVVYARFRCKDPKCVTKKSILFYGHYDVVPASSKDESWRTEPFELRGLNGYLYGRGVSDNKGPVLAALYAVADAVAQNELTSDVVFLIEGEQESGSRCFQRAVREHKDVIGKIDWILLANSYWLTDDIPCLTYGLRGVIHARIEVISENPDLHSGVDGSRLIDEPLKDLVALLAGLSDSSGKIKIPGFFECIPPISADEEERFKRISRTLIRANPALGDAENLSNTFKARWREPSLTIHRITTSGPSNSAIISRTASADISIRLVPDQTTAGIRQALESALESAFDELTTSNSLDVCIKHHAEPWLGDPNNKIFRTLDQAIMQVWGTTMAALPALTPAVGSTAPTATRSTLPIRPSDASPTPASSSTKCTSRVSSKAKPTRTMTVTSSTLSLISPTTPTRQPFPQPLDLVSSPMVAQSDNETNSGFEGPNSPSTQGASSVAKQSTNATVTSTTPQPPLYIREGGSIPSIRFLETEFGAPAAHFPMGQASDGAHLGNERMRILNLYRGREVFRKVFVELPLK